MKTRLAILALALMASAAMAAPTLVWSITEGNGKTIHPYGKWYTYTYSETGNAAEVDTSTTSTAKVITATVGRTVESSAGVGFGWGTKADSIKDLSVFEGVCLTYSAKNVFRLDFKQSTVKDGNYHGFDVPAQTAIDTLYIPFSKLAQEKGWGTTKTLDLTKQTGVQFSYKQSYIAEETSPILTNIIKIAAIHFGAGCGSHAPVVKSTATTAYELNEGEQLVVRMSDIFSDEDGDDLTITGTFSGNTDVTTSYTEAVSLDGSLVFTAKSNPSSSVYTAKLVATDPTGKTANFTFTITPVDIEHAPTIKDTTYQVFQGESVACTGKCSLYGTLANDVDGDEYTLHLVEEPTVGEFTFDAAKGQFSYKAPADFFGEVFFSLYADEDENPTSVSETVEVKIKVLDINDPPTVEILDSNITYTVGEGAEQTLKLNDSKSFIEVDEDFTDSIWVSISAENALFSDVDSDVSMGVKTNGLVNAAIQNVGKVHYVVVTAKRDANGLAKVTYYADDGEFQAGVDFYVKVASVVDKPVAVADTFEVSQDSVNKISAKLGVLKNDYDPEGESVLKASLADDAVEGKVELAEDGSFTYEVGDFSGKDTFSYFVTNEAGETSAIVQVVLLVQNRNKGPKIVAGVKDTVGTRVAALKEDFVNSIVYKSTEVRSWFTDPDGDTFTIKASTPDSVVNVTYNEVGAVTIKAIKNACGETVLNVIATDAQKNSTTLAIPVVVNCLNDAPTRVGGATDTLYVAPNGWRKAYHVNDLFEDVDDSVLTLKVTTVNKERIVKAEVIDDSLIVNLFDEKVYLQNKVPYSIKVNVTDAGGLTATPKTLVFITDPAVPADPSSIRVIAAAPKAGWQGAIAAERGMAAIFDMQGRVMWKAKLPVSEADVRNAAAKVQGRKVLMVNKQTWTIK